MQQAHQICIVLIVNAANWITGQQRPALNGSQLSIQMNGNDIALYNALNINMAHKPKSHKGKITIIQEKKLVFSLQQEKTKNKNSSPSSEDTYSDKFKGAIILQQKVTKGASIEFQYVLPVISFAFWAGLLCMLKIQWW